MEIEYLLRTWRTTDAPSLAWYANEPEVAVNLRDTFPSPYGLDDAKAYIQQCRERENVQLCRAIIIKGEAVGSITVIPGTDIYRRSAEIGYWLAKPYWGKGLMTEIAGQICREAFERFNIVRIGAEVYSRNMGSRRVLEKNGFTLEGILRRNVFKNGKLLNSRIYGLLKDDLKAKDDMKAKEEAKAKEEPAE